MNRPKHLLVAATLLAAVSWASAHEFQLGPIKIGHPWARPTLAGQSVGGAYLSLHNTGTAPDRLLGATSAASTTVEVHEMRMQGDVMRMREVDGLALAPGKTVKLEPGGYHLMLVGLKVPLKLGDKLPLTLRFEKAGSVDVLLFVESKPAATQAEHQHDHKK